MYPGGRRGKMRVNFSRPRKIHHEDSVGTWGRASRAPLYWGGCRGNFCRRCPTNPFSECFLRIFGAPCLLSLANFPQNQGCRRSKNVPDAPEGLKKYGEQHTKVPRGCPNKHDCLDFLKTKQQQQQQQQQN